MIYDTPQPIGINRLSDILIGLSVKISNNENITVKIKPHSIPTNKTQIINVVIIPAITPSHVFFLFQRICLFPYRIPIWDVIESLIQLTPNIAKKTIGGLINAENICPMEK